MKTFIRLSEVQRMTSLGHSTIYRLMGEGDFPQSYRLTPGAVAWDSDEIAEWLSSRQRFGSEKRVDRLAASVPQIALQY